MEIVDFPSLFADVQPLSAGDPVDEILAAILLFIADPERAATAAISLSQEFTTVSEMFAQKPSRLRQIEGLCDKSAMLISSIGALHTRALREWFSVGSFDENSGRVLDYCRMVFMNEERSVARIFYVCGDKLSLESELIVGSMGKIEIYHREVVKTALLANASWVYVVIGRNTGTEHLSDQEQILFRNLSNALEAVGISSLNFEVVVK